MDSNNAVNSSQLNEQMNTAIPNKAHTVISADPARPTDILQFVTADQTGTPAEDTTPGKEMVTVMPDPPRAPGILERRESAGPTAAQSHRSL